MQKETDNFKTLGQRIAYARHKKGLSQKELGKLVGVSDPTVSDWEWGNANPKMCRLPKIAEVLEVSEDWLIGKSNNFSMKNQAVNSKSFTLTPKQQQLVEENKRVIGLVFRKYCKYNSMLRFEDIYGDAAIALCYAAKVFEEKYKSEGSFFGFAYHCVKCTILQLKIRKQTNDSLIPTSLNVSIGQDDSGDPKELGEEIPAPDEWEQIEYRILLESIYQKVEPVLTVREKEVFRLWLHGEEYKEIANKLGISRGTAVHTRTMAKKKCCSMFNPDDFFA